MPLVRTCSCIDMDRLGFVLRQISHIWILVAMTGNPYQISKLIGHGIKKREVCHEVDHTFHRYGIATFNMAVLNVLLPFQLFRLCHYRTLIYSWGLSGLVGLEHVVPTFSDCYSTGVDSGRAGNSLRVVALQALYSWN
jgi:hypothetical protein